MTADEPQQRLIEWTGERCVPWADDLQVIYEHYHRYAFAATLTRGRRVLDLACGEGFGAALMAAEAAEVVGVDIDHASVRHARDRYQSAKIRFEVGSMIDPDLMAEQEPFDVITCFEAVEHVVEHDQLMQLVRNRLAPRGIFLSSTPDVAVYTHDHGNDNPFHVRELTQDEYHKWLSASFENVVLLRQNVAVGSMIHGGGSGRDAVMHTLRRESAENWTVRAGAPHTYLLGVASDGSIADVAGSGVLVDPALTMVQHAVQAGERRAHALENEVSKLRTASQRREDDMREATDAAARAAVELAEAVARERRVTNERDQARGEVDHFRRARDGLTAELDRLRHRVARDEARLSWLKETGARLTQAADRLSRENAELRAAQSAIAQRLIGRYRSSIERFAPRGTRRRDAYERALGRPTGLVPPVQDLAPVALTTSEEPVVSVVIPVYGQWPHTRACLASIARCLPAIPFEVIVVDDASPDDSADRVASCPGVRLVRTPRNLGFIGACNLGAEHARGELLMFLNNDTEVRPGWLDALVDVVDARPDVGLVGSKLVYPDGRLQECGGIIWADGTGWNYGRDAVADDPEYGSMRDVDYCSGAAVLVRRDLFRQIGGFDERFAPAYYEDTDLAFEVRAAGYRTMVQPASVVVHHEGVSNGTDANAGLKRHQEINRGVFVDKWKDALRGHLPEASPTNLWIGRQRTADGHRGGLVLVADHQVPRTDEDSGSVRMFRLLEQLVALDQRVVFFAMNHALPEKYTSALQRLGVTVIGDTGRQAEFLRHAGAELRLAILSRPQVACDLLEQLREHAPRCVIAYDTVDLHFLRLARQADLADERGDGVLAARLRRRADASRELELALVRASDVTCTVSDLERDLLVDLVPDARVELLSNVHEVDHSTVSIGGRAGVLFVGSFDHLPNRDSARWLATEIMPLVRRRFPDAALHIVGSNPPDEVRELAGPAVIVHGWVAELEPMYRAARVVAAPIRFGAGVKGKVGESLCWGVPVVGTPMAFEGMHLTDGQDVLVGETAAEIADQIAILLGDDELWSRLSAAGRAAVTGRFGPQVAQRALSGLLIHGHLA